MFMIRFMMARERMPRIVMHMHERRQSMIERPQLRKREKEKNQYCEITHV